MIRSKYGPGVVVRDVEQLDALIQEAIAISGPDYGCVLNYVVLNITQGDYSNALKANALKSSSWFKKHIYDIVELEKVGW